MTYYILADDAKTPILCESAEAWVEWFVSHNTELAGDRDTGVSTVFLGVPHCPGNSLWQTRVFGGPHDGFTLRYESYNEAKAGHDKTVAFMKKVMEKTK
jgi:hypothetical protein